jgi:hypothetical protein
MTSTHISSDIFLSTIPGLLHPALVYHYLLWKIDLPNERKSYVEKKTEGAVIRSKAKWIHEVERNTRSFFNLQKRNYINKSMQS